MIYLFYGSDSEKARRKAFEWVAKAREKEPNLTYVRLAREDLSAGALLEAVTSNSLFAKRTLTLIDDPYVGRTTSHNEEIEGEGSESPSSSVLDDYIDMLAESENAIVILAPSARGGSASGGKLKRLADLAEKVYKFDAPVTQEFKRGFNSGLVDALGAKNREKLWLEVVRALRAGDAPEKLHGLLHWKARDLMDKGSRAWKPEESRALSLNLIGLLQSSRRKGLDLSESLERFALHVT